MNEFLKITDENYDSLRDVVQYSLFLSRHKKHLTLDEVSKLSGVEKFVIEKIEIFNRNEQFKISEILKLFDAYGEVDDKNDFEKFLL